MKRQADRPTVADDEGVRHLLRGEILDVDSPVMSRVWREMVDAHRTKGWLTRDPVRAFVILAEEVGEVARLVLESTRPSAALSNVDYRTRLLEELAQAASVILFWMHGLENPEREEKT